MAPPVHLALALLFFPTLILSEPFHLPLTRRRHTELINWTDKANQIRIKYGYATASRRSSRRSVAGVPILDQVDIVFFLFLFYFNSSQE